MRSRRWQESQRGYSLRRGIKAAGELSLWDGHAQSVVLAGSVLTLAVIASTASLLPAMRAANIDPMAAIRCG